MHRSLDAAHPQLNAAELNVCDEVAQGIDPGQIDIGDGVADEHERVGMRLLVVEEPEHRLVQIVGVSEEDRCLEADDQHAFARLGVRMAVDVAMALAAGDLPEHGHARA